MIVRTSGMQKNSLPILEKLIQELHPRYLITAQQDECFMASALSRIREETLMIKYELMTYAFTFNEENRQLQWYVRVHQQVITTLRNSLQAYIKKVHMLPGQGAVYAELYRCICEYLDSVEDYISIYFADLDVPEHPKGTAAFSRFTHTTFSIAGLKVRWRLFFSAIFQGGRARHPQQHYQA